MGLTNDERELLKQLYQRFQDGPLDPDDPFYVPVYQDGDYDPVRELEIEIRWARFETTQFLSGFRGAGKTTELRRLKKRLADEGYSVVMASYEEYLSPTDEVDLGSLLLTIAGAFEDAARKDLNHLVGLSFAPSAWKGMWEFVKGVEVQGAEVGLKAGVLNSEADLKLHLKSTPSVRSAIREFLKHRVGALKGKVDEFFVQAVEAIQARNGGKPVVFLFDSIEKVRGTASTEPDFQRSIELLFSQSEFLRFPKMHMVYAVPPWLKFANPGLGPLLLLPAVRLEDDDGRPYAQGRAAMRRILERRFAGLAPIERIFGSDRIDDVLITKSGGDFRTFLRLVAWVLRAADRGDSLPVAREAVERACDAERDQMLPIAIEDAQRLDRIAQDKKDPLESSRPDDIAWLTRMLDNHRLLYLKNGGERYHLHPLIAAEVEEIVERHPPPAR